MKNCEFISELRRGGPLKFVMISCVVQKNNYREMPAFVALAKKYGYDLALFTRIRIPPGISPSLYAQTAIADEFHPQHYDLLDVLRNDCFDSPPSGLGTFLNLRKKAICSEKESS